MTRETLLKDAMNLTSRERSLLADELWRSVALTDRDLHLTSSQADDLAHRQKEDDSGGSDLQEWDSFRAELNEGE